MLVLAPDGGAALGRNTAMSMARHRPIGVTILAVLTALIALVTAYHALQYLGLFPFTWGPLSFYGQDWLGAALYAVSAAIWVWVTVMLWRVDKQGWIFVVIISALNLLLAGVSILGASTFQALLPDILLNGAVLLYALTPGVKDAFGVGRTITYQR
jgi:hypothetical protein